MSLVLVFTSSSVLESMVLSSFAMYISAGVDEDKFPLNLAWSIHSETDDDLAIVC